MTGASPEFLIGAGDGSRCPIAAEALRGGPTRRHAPRRMARLPPRCSALPPAAPSADCSARTALPRRSSTPAAVAWKELDFAETVVAAEELLRPEPEKMSTPALPAAGCTPGQVRSGSGKVSGPPPAPARPRALPAAAPALHRTLPAPAPAPALSKVLPEPAPRTAEPRVLETAEDRGWQACSECAQRTKEERRKGEVWRNGG